MTVSLPVFSNCDAPQPRHLFCNVKAHHANDRALVKKYEWMISGFGVVGMVLVVCLELAAILKQHLAAKGMKFTPLLIVARRPKLVFDHMRRES